VKEGPATTRLLATAAAVLAAACGSSGPEVTVRWDRATYTLPAADGCSCAWIIATVDGQVQWPDRVDPLDAGVTGEPAVTLPAPTNPPSAGGPVDPVMALAAEVAMFCGQGVAGSWRFRATVAGGGASASADATVVVP
jgi:hypothetical protein